MNHHPSHARVDLQDRAYPGTNTRTPYDTSPPLELGTADLSRGASAWPSVALSRHLLFIARRNSEMSSELLNNALV